MAYVKINWETGDIITAEKLNHMENGIANSFNLNAVRNGSKGIAYSGEEIQAIMSTAPDRILMIYNNTDDTDMPNYTTVIYRLNKIMADTENTIRMLAYAYDDSGMSERQTIDYMVLSSDDNGDVEYLEMATASSTGVDWLEYSYNAGTGRWEIIG